MIVLVAKLKAKEGKGDEFAAAATAMVAAVAKAEAGRCLAYTLHRAENDPDTFVFYEQYADADAVAAHGSTDHMKEFGGKIRGLLDGRPQIERYTVVTSLNG